jgi:hypothetical protein
MTKEINPRELLRAIRRKQTPPKYAWTVQVSKSIDNILEMIRNRETYRDKPYAATASFNDLAEAQEYAVMVMLHGYQCVIIDNSTGEIDERSDT